MAAPALAPHTHGAAELRITVEGGQLEIALESPLDNLLGFEHPPRTEAERAAVRAMAAKLRQAQTLWVPTPAAGCLLSRVELASSALAPELLGGPGPAARARAPAPEVDAHADLDASFAFVCAAPAELKGVDVGLLQAFPGFRRLAVQVVGPRGQSATVLTPGKRAVRW